ncbi:MAG TPA: hypothetical protein VEF06_02815, partial [Bryobacteraceae bacterium]|nr:hypothetical protein [Bryobacteraceae bacterium]
MKTRTRGFAGTTLFSLAELLIFIVNLLIGGKIYSVEYSNQLGSIEGTFIALARRIAAHPAKDLLWWPLWDCGLPFQNTYLPLMHFLSASVIWLTGYSAALAYHQVAATFFCLGPMTMLLTAWVMTRDLGRSFAAALAYSIVSPSALLTPDLGSVLRLRRLQFLVMWGEGPETAALALFPIAVLFLYLALNRPQFRYKVLAGVFMGLTVLANAFGGTILAMAALALADRKTIWRIGAMALAAWLWISPLVPPSVLYAMRVNSPTVEGDHRFTTRTLAGIAILAAAYLACRSIPPRLRFFWTFAALTSGVVLLARFGHMYVLPQPNRYEQAMDMALCLLIAFVCPRLPKSVAIALLLMAAVQTRQQVRFARGLIQPTDITQTAIYRGAAWIDRNLHGERVMVGGAYSYYVDDFFDIPQLHGGHDPMLPNPKIRDVVFQIYSHGDGNVTASLMRAYGVHAIFLPGGSPALDPVLPVLWRDGPDVIYGVPGAEPARPTWTPGWKASGGKISKDEWGLLRVEPGSAKLTYDGGWELTATVAASSLVMLVTIVIGLVRAFH